MESLLSLSFDNISSKDQTKIRKGLRQIEGLLVQICLSTSASSSPSKRRASMIPSSTQQQLPGGLKTLAQLADDPAFREFFRLQEGFEWNVATRLIGCLERLLGMGNSGQNDVLIISTLELLYGILLLHPPSRSLFSREIYMNLLLDLLDPYNVPAIQSTTLLVLVTALLGQPRNTRVFEATDGLLTVTSLFKSPGTPKPIKLKLVEFLYFYLMPETPTIASVSQPGTALGGNGGAGLGRRESRLLGAFERRTYVEGDRGGGMEEDEAKETRSTESKQKLLARYMSNVEDLVQDLKTTPPYSEWMAR